jgi:hypothetical protein
VEVNVKFAMPQPVRTGRVREGVAFRARDIDAWIMSGGLEWTMLQGRYKFESPDKEGIYIMSDVSAAYEAAQQVNTQAMEAYNASLAAFRSTIKNDLASISAAADRVQKESAKIATAYRASIDALLSQDMQTAIENAERLASALERIADIKGHKLTFSVLDNTPTR